MCTSSVLLQNKSFPIFFIDCGVHCCCLGCHHHPFHHGSKQFSDHLTLCRPYRFQNGTSWCIQTSPVQVHPDLEFSREKIWSTNPSSIGGNKNYHNLVTYKSSNLLSWIDNHSIDTSELQSLWLVFVVSSRCYTQQKHMLHNTTTQVVVQIVTCVKNRGRNRGRIRSD